MNTFLTVAGLLSAAFVFGTTAWFFFVQAPVLLARLGRERFVPIQMMATKTLGKVLVAATALTLAAAAAGAGAGFAGSPLVWSAALALFGALVNERVVITRALKAGGRGRVEVRGKDAEASTVGFAADGVGDATATMHRLVVLFVVVMLGGVVWHLLLLAKVVGSH